MTRKVMRPKAWDPKKLKFQAGPYWSQPKIDGCRSYNPEGTLLARTQKLHRNRHVTAQFSKPEYIGFDGEMAAGHECDPALVRLTSSALSTIEGDPFILWHIFDYVTTETATMPYSSRYRIASKRIAESQAQGLCGHLRMVPYLICESIEDVEAAHAHWMELGYEGSCVYNPRLPHKEGDSSATHGGVNRIKDFIDFEAMIIGITEGDANNNEAQTNELGRTFRTSHQENKVPNGMVGSLQCRSLVDVFDLHDKKLLLIAKDSEFTSAPGALTHDERKYYFTHQSELMDGPSKFRFFPKGMKDKPRFAQFVSKRSAEDM